MRRYMDTKKIFEEKTKNKLLQLYEIIILNVLFIWKGVQKKFFYYCKYRSLEFYAVEILFCFFFCCLQFDEE